MIAAQRALFAPLLGFVALAFATGLSILLTRFVDLARRRPGAAFYEDYAGGGPIGVQRTTRQLANQFEFPVLFLTAMSLAISIRANDSVLPALAWAYVAMRWGHAIVHVGHNRLWLRTPVFIGSNLVLLTLWIRLAMIV